MHLDNQAWAEVWSIQEVHAHLIAVVHYDVSRKTVQSEVEVYWFLLGCRRLQMRKKDAELLLDE